MLSDSFVDWWFSPWIYASNVTESRLGAHDRLGHRDGYRLWCATAKVAPDLPANFSRAWEIAACTEADELLATARLFAGLIAAREQNTSHLSTLPFADHKWCMSVAGTQPLIRVGYSASTPTLSLSLAGLFELALHLNYGFPGMWSRIRVMLPNDDAFELDALLTASTIDNSRISSAASRAQRCWRMCRNRVLES